MKIFFLGHSEVMIEFQNKKGKPIRILNDAWLTNYAFGDFLQRNPTWFHTKKSSLDFLGKIDLIYLSHPHSDHFDPYSLFLIYQQQNPKILLPENLSWVKTLLKKYLPNTEILILKNFEPISYEDLNFLGVTFQNHFETNEKDVMNLFIDNEREILFFEEDVAIPDTKEAYDILFREFTKNNFQQRIYVCVRNELEGFFLSTDEPNGKKRKEKLQNYFQKRQQEIEWDYYKFEENLELKNIYRLKNFVKIYTGQGMIYPVDFFSEFLKISGVLPFLKITEWEKEIQKEYQNQFLVLSQEPGMYFELEKGKLTKKESFSSEFKFYPVGLEDIDVSKTIKDQPVFDEERDISKQEQLIEKLLDRLYIYLTTQPEIPIVKLLKENYTIKILYGTSSKFYDKNYSIDFEHFKFYPNPHPQKIFETYWANDLEDYYFGRLDQFSSVLLDLSKFETFYLWTMMGIPFLNNDIVYNKIEFHFERAIKGLTPDDYVLPIIQKKFIF
ncbi:MAG: hypothetical protein NZ853_06765 [Leptospiraceae bacterium]|nr:hypothetical protein [Leptospiraceae bacterium]MDW7975865.1 hypothetical protein [Leptospiraceae bacterium]